MAFASILGESAEAPSSYEEEEEDSLSYVDDEDDKDYDVKEEGRVKPEKTLMRPGRGERKRGKRGVKSRLGGEEEQDDDEEEDEGMSVGDVFKLEMELNRENKKLMKVRRRKLLFPVLSLV